MKNSILQAKRFFAAKNLNRFICFLCLALMFFSFSARAQSPGDTIVVKAFKYGSTTRDTALQFPAGNLTFEKIILKYNMRCKNALVSTQSQPNQGCGEWDYSCNTYVVDSSKIEAEINTAPKYLISNFNGNTFNYTSIPLYDYFNYAQTQVTLNSIISETQHTLGIGVLAQPNVLKSNERSGRSQLLYTAAELNAAGLSAGNIDGFILDVANTGGTTNFLKIGIQHTAQSSLNAGAVTLGGFTNVFNSNYVFAAGNNRIQFHSPFVWNGTSNILLDLSFTNTSPGNGLVLNGSNTSSVTTLFANNNYALDLSSSGHVNINPALFSGISNELTVSFWAYGTASLMPTTTSIVYGYGTNPNERHLNIHLPWNNNDVYFDCGYSAGGFDRINKTASASEQGGQWNHWAFTKNAGTGVMSIYLNGSLWSTGTAKTKAISILNLILGKDKDLLNNYKGKVNEFTVWNKALSLTDIQTWMNKPIDATHPFYSNLLAYYKMTEGNGLSIADAKNSVSSTGVNVQWTYERGNKLERMFYQSNVRPNLVFVNGTYSLSTSPVVVKDSVARNPNIVQDYSITSNATATPMAHDVVTLVSTVNLFETKPLNVYDGDTGILTGTIAVASQSSIAMSTLNYTKRYPFYNELLSFVTPYGKGLDMGVKGKTWYYDVSDFAPVLKGNKRFLMSLGGENQEQMDIDFWFIVGTPPRTVVEFNQLWQGGARIGGSSIASVNNNTRFPVLNVPMHASGQKFKVRSVITGHGQHGEFSQNGGVITHFFNVNGGSNEFSWPITMECGDNPVMAQGGTWVYDRQGWCPGQTSLLTENDITPFVTPGTTVTLDYNCSPPQVASGDYRYIAAHQLITYGPANHSNDAAIVDVLAPSTKVLYSRSNPMCSSPVLMVTNTGSSAMTTLDIDFWLNNASQKESFQWTGNAAFMDTVRIVLPIGLLWTHDVNAGANLFHAEIKKVNDVADQYAFNNMYHSAFVLPDVIANEFTVEFKTNNYPYESTYVILDDYGNQIPGASSLSSANTTYTDNYLLDGCFKLVVRDLGGDGLQWWANTAQGNGFVRLKNANGTIIKSFPTDFGNGFEYSFSTLPPNYVSVKEENFASAIQVFPNPAHDTFQVSGSDLENCIIKLTDLLGRTIEVPMSQDKKGMTFYTSNLKPGVYLVSISKGTESTVKKMVIQ